MPQDELSDPVSNFKVHLLDVGSEKYGDCILCEFGSTTILIDGAHQNNHQDKGESNPSIQRQIGQLLDQSPDSLEIDLLIVSHAHADHIGCLPTLISNGWLTAKYALVADPALGWGNMLSDNLLSDEEMQTPARKLAAALREEVHSFNENPRELEEFIDGAAKIEREYKTMLAKMDGDGTFVVRYGPDKQRLQELIEQLKGYGVTMNVLGPSLDQLLLCAEALHTRSNDSFQSIESDLAADSDADIVETYLKIIKSRNLLAPDGVVNSDGFVNGEGAFVNLQSLVISFQYRGKKLLFTGDHQLSKPGVTNKKILSNVDRLIDAIAADGPYSFLKLSHHGSDNGFSEKIRDSCGTTAYGMCGGSVTDSHHPHSEVLTLLKAQLDAEWARTDRNGLSTFTFTQAAVPKIKVKTGKINNAIVNGSDIEAGAGGTSPTPPTSTIAAVERKEPETPPSGQFVRSVRRDASGAIELKAYANVPASVRRVDVSFRIDSDDGDSGSGDESSFEGSGRTVNIAGGRVLPDLLFVTNRQVLSRNIGKSEAATILGSVGLSKHAIIDDIPDDPNVAVKVVQDALARNGKIKGVVLLGGYDVVPSQRVDCLSTDLRQKIGTSRDSDNFIVWCDDLYGDLNSDRLSEVPISRIPDGKYAPLMLNAIQASPKTASKPRAGVRNAARPFADVVFNSLPGSDPILSSQPTLHNQTPNYSLEGDRIYLMLHGSNLDASRFWGEDRYGNCIPALTINNLPVPCAPVVFAGCCWGALIVDTIASHYRPGNPMASLAPNNSIALACLSNGALAFVGCTGEHYSPAKEPNYFGGPMHAAFWKYYNAGSPAALALLQAKREYAQGIPHGRTDPEPIGIEFKMLYQFTCLGIGW